MDVDHSEFNEEISALFEQGMAEFKNSQFIVLTHEGPFGSPTTKNTYLESNITYHTGNKRLTELLLAHKERVVCNIHGHAHDGAFYFNLNLPRQVLPVINPGAVTQGEFGEVELTRGAQGKWAVSKMEKHLL
mmetsp:Transcript_5274/g.8164  ORF Transcript_5274/g.8164 Transcript_5274/m.8164 type:complete len:132 (+) Transcript_5274:463-858(+)